MVATETCSRCLVPWRKNALFQIVLTGLRPTKPHENDLEVISGPPPKALSTLRANIAAGRSGEIEYSMGKLRPSDCLIRSVRVERINGHYLLPLGVIIARDLD